MFKRSTCQCCRLPTLLSSDGFEPCTVCGWDDTRLEDGLTPETAREHLLQNGPANQTAETALSNPARMELIAYAMSVLNGHEKLDSALLESLLLADELAQGF